MYKRVLVSIIFFVSMPSIAVDEIKCNSGGNQLEMNVCAGDDFKKSDKELNKTYQSVIEKEVDNTLFISKLRRAQKAWIAFRDAELEAEFACAEADVRLCWGSMYPMSYSYRKAELTRERNKHLQKILKYGHGE